MFHTFAPCLSALALHPPLGRMALHIFECIRRCAQTLIHFCECSTLWHEEPLGIEDPLVPESPLGPKRPPEPRPRYPLGLGASKTPWASNRLLSFVFSCILRSFHMFY